MKTRADLVRAWLRKADSDLTNAGLCIEQEQALDTACFHAQQAAEKCLKAYLTAYEIEFPFSHNLVRLVDLGTQHDSSFASLRGLSEELTPYAVELRYDAEFWPALETANQALSAALTIRDFVVERLPEDMR